MMYIKETKSTPFVQLSIEDCIFQIKGLSFSDETDSFYQPIMNWIETELPKLNCELNCEFNFSVFNSVTYKYVLNMMAKFMHFNKEGKNIKVTWYFDKDDEDNKESAEDITELFNIPFELKEISK
ncbi:MAG: DUF1987 domain-containing protein [Bacteroidales bacterium]|nr:DUF1987 domain-containing protein [Bacteroidales bacterium]